jgi:hypothetical protein
MLLSNSIPRFLTVGEGERLFHLKDIDDAMIFERCVVPVRRNSVLEGFTIKRFRERNE